MLEERMVDLGNLEIKSGKVRVTDPCYDLDVWCAKTLENVATGKWKAFTNMVTVLEGGAHERNGSLIMVHDDMKETPGQLDWRLIGSDIGVDSGQAGIYDLEAFGKDHLYPEVTNTLDLDLSQSPNRFYAANCDLTLTELGAGVLVQGVVSSSGWGDGVYNYYTVKNDEDEIVAIKVVFIDADDFDEDEEE